MWKPGIVLMAGVGLACAAYVLIDASTSSLYACVDNTDSHVVAKRALDWGHVLTAISVAILAVYLASGEPRKPFKHLVSAFGGLTILVYMSGLILGGQVCDGVRCPTSNAADLVKAGGSVVAFNKQVTDMLTYTGISAGENSFLCGGLLSPTFFSIPSNYCTARLDSVCLGSTATSLATVGRAERCLVFTCSDMVEGAVSRWAFAQFGLLLQMITCAIMMHAAEGKKDDPPKRNPPAVTGAVMYPQDDLISSTSRPGVLRRRRSIIGQGAFNF